MTSRYTNSLRAAWLCGLMLVAGLARAQMNDDFDTQLLALQRTWDAANYNTNADARRSELAALSEQMQTFVQAHPDRAEALVWQGIVLSSYAGAKGGLGALSLAKRARDCLMAAVRIDGDVLEGSAYTSLGALFYKVPGFPIGFGNHEKAAEYLHQALALNPDGIDPNFFYGELLFENGDYSRSLQYLQKAQAAPKRPDRPLADSGRRAEIDALIEKVRAKLS